MGPPTAVTMTPVAGERGLYEAAYETAHTGVFRFEARENGGRRARRAQFAVRREDGVIEHYHVQQNRPLLERLAAATGGNVLRRQRRQQVAGSREFSEAGSVERRCSSSGTYRWRFSCCCS